MNIAIIPARGGSKRIPRKNIKLFCGKPMLAHSIGVALESGIFDRVIVSTDDEEIAAVAREYGAQVPFMRPPDLANDYADTTSVVAHAVEWLGAQGSIPQAVCCIYATAPFVRVEDLKYGREALKDPAVDYAFSVTRFGFPIQRACRITDGGRVEMFQPEHLDTRSQDLEAAYHDAGQFYWGRPEAWMAGRPIFSKAAVPVILPAHRVQDIDTPEDWRRAELMFELLKESGD